MDPNAQQGAPEPFEYANTSNKGYYTFVVILLIVLVVVGIALIAVSRFTSSLQNTIRSTISVKQSYENPFAATQAQAYENPFSTTQNQTENKTYQNPFQ